MTAPTAIRPYGPEDRDRLLAIWLDASRAGHPFFTEDQLREQARLVRDIYLPEAENWVATLEGEPVGFIGLIDSFVGGLFVDPARHGCGAGRALVEHARRLKGMLELEVYARNSRADGFYRHLGFREIGRRARDDNGLPFEVVHLRWEQPPS